MRQKLRTIQNKTAGPGLCTRPGPGARVTVLLLVLLFCLASVPGSPMTDGGTARAAAKDASPLAATNAVDEFTILERGDNYHITIIYPGVGNAIADAELALWARGRATGFAKGVGDIGKTGPGSCELHIYYETIAASQHATSIVFTTTVTMGTADPESGLTTFAFDLGDGRRLSFGDIFRQTDGLFDFFSRRARAALHERLGDAADLRLLESGTVPDPANFDLFSLSPTGVVLHFPPGQAAPASAGYLRVPVGLDELAPFAPYLRLWGKAELS